MWRRGTCRENGCNSGGGLPAGCGGDGKSSFARHRYLRPRRHGRHDATIARPVEDRRSGRWYLTWRAARHAALTPEQVDSPLAARPYDLRHACLSTWLAAGVAPTQVAQWAGHSVDVLLRVYAKCLDDTESLAVARIETALPTGRDDPPKQNSGAYRARMAVARRPQPDLAGPCRRAPDLAFPQVRGPSL
jgi:hypothetical protein